MMSAESVRRDATRLKFCRSLPSNRKLEQGQQDEA
jgi:hypothetical protein